MISGRPRDKIGASLATKEIQHPLQKFSRLFQRGQVSALGDDFQLGIGDQPVEVSCGFDRYHRVLLSPHDQGGKLKAGDVLVQPLASVGQVLQQVMDGVSVAALQMLPVGQVD